MIYSNLTRKAMQIAYQAHHGQFDHAGVPYIFHPYHLAEQMDDEYSVCVALLHDVMEDTDVTLEELEREFPSEVTEALKLLTHDPEEDYFIYVERLSHNTLASKVKMADLTHNSDPERNNELEIPEEIQMWYRYKYGKAKEILGMKKG